MGHSSAPFSQRVPQGFVLEPLLLIIYMLPLGQIIHHHKLSYTDNVSQHQPLQSPLFSTSSKTSNWTLGCGSRVVAPHSGWYLSWCGRIFPAPVRWRNYPQPGCPLVRYPPVVIIYQIHSDSGHYAETTIHTCSISLTEAWTGCSMLRTHLPECRWQHVHLNLQ